MNFSKQEVAVLSIDNEEDLHNSKKFTEFKTKMTSINCLGYSIFSGNNLPELLPEKTIINTINPHCYIVAKKDPQYQKALKSSTILIPDGIGIVWAIKTLNKQKIARFSGSMLHMELLQKMNETGGKVFYLGSSKYTLQKIHNKIESDYPNIILDSYSPPYKDIFTDDDNNKMISSINKFKPDVLFVGMTAPKQEKWSFQFKDQLNARTIASVGAVFDFYAGTVKRPGKFWISLGLEWLPRLLREPKRLWRRNLISTPSFILNVLAEKIKMFF